MKDFLNEAPDSLLEFARASVHVGDVNTAFRNLQQFVSMGQSTKLLETLVDFAPLRERPDFAGIQDGMKVNRSPISLGSMAFSTRETSSHRKLRRCTRTGNISSCLTTCGIGVLEIATKQVRWLSMRGRFALNGIDGLYFQYGRLIAVQNGTSPERVVAFTLDGKLTRIESETIIERSTDTLGDPTHGVVIDNDFYYIANSGWDVIDDHGNRKPGAKPSMPRIMRVQLQGL